MIVIAGTVPINPDKKADALAVMRTMSDASQAEDGCISYRFFMNPWDESEVLIFEEWEDAAALAAHFEAPHMATFREQIPQFVTGEMSLKRYEVASVSDL